MNNQTIQKKIWKSTRKTLLILLCLFTFNFAWQASFLTNNIANAGSLGDSGLKNQLDGRAQQGVGRTESLIDDVGHKLEKSADRAAGKADVLNKQIKASAQQNADRTQEGGNRLEDAKDNAVEAVKEFFGQ